MRVSKCKGCHTYESNTDNEGFPICNNVPFVYNHYCPCISCIIKGVCNSTCDNFISYLDWVECNHPKMLKQHTVLTGLLTKHRAKKKKFNGITMFNIKTFNHIGIK